jgi:hypothetical protein
MAANGCATLTTHIARGCKSSKFSAAVVIDGARVSPVSSWMPHMLERFGRNDKRSVHIIDARPEQLQAGLGSRETPMPDADTTV